MGAGPSITRGSRGPRVSTGGRLVLAFAAVLGVFGAALLIALPAMTELDRADVEVAGVDRAKHAGHRVDALVREQYIHQAHTVIEGNRSHLDHYRDVARVTREAATALVAFADSPAERALATEIASLVSKSDADFLAVTLPAIERAEHDEVLRLHAEMEKAVVRVAKLVRDLNARFEARSDTARTLAERARRRVRVTLYVCFTAATLLAAVVALVTTRSIVRRVRILRAGLRRVGDGDLSERIHLDGTDELAELAHGLDDMTRRLERHQRELVQSQKLASIGRLCSGVAHEINGPLGIILGYAKVIRREGADDEALRAIEDEAKQCQRIVQALLDTSRHDIPRSDPVDLVQLANEAVDRLRTTGKLVDRNVAVRRPSADVVASGDDEKLRQVVLNLLTNAAEATLSGGTITIEATDRGGRAVLSVEDDGAGVSASARERLFEPFFTTKDQGTGLGLAISRAIVEAHRGEISVTARTGGGTRVEVRLQKASAAAEDFA